ncbi:DUF1707 domain-containing protein [Rhodococcoides fascians A21d2]|uniref:DUF1707 SHOCT-like domain-containing protein n=1 Tax=Rhodococcoides fascians TaxID=1828 RepID=UPI00056B0056|nr:DUF1707 domain-containing protein [Rhodococcus fascians]QII00139.1 DUF1707 domain-containing protein [Rhodococcus fascians A21d2]
MSDQLPDRDRSQVRAADADRNLVAQLLSDAFANGQLTVSEYDERTAAVYQAKTYGELDLLTGDLALSPPPASAPSGGSSNDRVIAIMSGAVRKGEWTAASRIDAVAFWGGIELDLRRASFSSADTTINCVAIMGGIEVTVPPGVSVEVRGMGIMGGFEHVSAAHPGAPRVIVTGFAFWGGVSVEIKAPDK